jgi:hypothetical protein
MRTYLKNNTACNLLTKIEYAKVFIFFMLFNTSVFSQKTETIYRLKNDTLQNYYKALLPDSTNKGLLIILGGFCTAPDEVMKETTLPVKACKAGYTVILPFIINDCNSIDVNNVFETNLEKIVAEVIERYNIPKDKFIIGGQSLGGHRALFYAEQAYKKNNKTIIKPNAVFGVDPPLNMKRLWNSFTYGVTINFSPVSVGEGREMLRRFKIMYGGSPVQNPKKYEEVSSFYPDAKDGGNAKYLKNVPVRLYCDPDINWIIENRRGNFETMNANDLSGCISQLKLLGNKNAEFINCLGKGFKPDGTRHPHYFSMLDADEFIIWANKILGYK